MAAFDLDAAATATMLKAIGEAARVASISMSVDSIQATA
jgi:hypothetical protein